MFCVICASTGRDESAAYVIDGESLCAEHGKEAMDRRDADRAARDRVHAAGGRVQRK